MSFQSVKNKLIVGLVVLILSSPALVSLASDQEYDSLPLIQAYANASQNGDLNAIKTAWTNLNNNQQAVTVMQKNFPSLYYLFQVRGLYFQVSDLQATQPKSDVTLPPVEEAAEQTQSIHSESPEIKKFSVSPPQPNPLPSNGEVVERSKDAPFRDNRNIALDNPNQNRLDNKTLIDRRKDAFHEQKFQKAPDLLVPRGDNQSTSSAPSP
jgi:hypothetical protein